MDEVKIYTNNRPRDLIAFCDLTKKEQAEFDYIEGEDQYSPRLVRYRGWVYDVNEFTSVPAALNPPMFGGLKAWQGYQSDSYFSGIVIRYTNDFESVIVGRYVS